MDCARAVCSLAATCEFGTRLEDHLIDHFLYGLNNEQIALWLATENLLFYRFMAPACL
jgi:hypothetical protein